MDMMGRRRVEHEISDLLLEDFYLALRLSNLVLILSLFLVGYCGGISPTLALGAWERQ
jgi:hypothetical protein